jgi:hypoxanthine phosphoribosyltransferase
MKKIHRTYAQVEGGCLSIIRQMMKDNWTPDYIVGITRGGAIPAILISQFTSIPMKPLQVSLRDSDECVSDIGMSEDAYDGKKILVVDDINDSGATLNWIKQDWQESSIPAEPRWNDIWHNSVRFATIIDNAGSNAHVDYCAEEIDKREDDVWIVFPWEHWWAPWADNYDKG